MSGGAPAGALAAVEQALLAAEATIDVVGAFRALNHQQIEAQLQSALHQGSSFEPHFRFRPFSSEASVRQILQAAEVALGSYADDWVARLLLGRVAELSLELSLVGHRGRAALTELSQRRYPLESTWLQGADALAQIWLNDFVAQLSSPKSEASESQPDERVDLAAAFISRCRELGLDVPVIPRDLTSLSAVSDGALLVKEGARVSALEAARLFEHEVRGHFLPRRQAASHPAPFSIGTEGTSQDEEGRAVLLEAEAGLLSTERRGQLALRHLCAVGLREGRPLLSQARALVALGVPLELAANVTLRVYRGAPPSGVGGLGREVIYLPGYLRCRQAKTEQPAVYALLSQGRLGLAGAATLLQHAPEFG